MKNLFDYLLYYGNISFDKMEFNEVDGLILALLSYVKLRKIVPENNDFIYLEEACFKFLKKYSEKDFKKEDWLFPNSYQLMLALQSSKRFYHAKLYNWAANVNSKGQFGAVTIRLPNHVTYVSFEGTDSNVVGWKEDFQLMYQFPISSHVMAKEYLNETVNIFDRDIYIGGHSKGGNLAMYAYMYGKEKIKKRVKRVYNFDGPGFLKEVISSDLYQEMLPKLTTFIPKESVIGVILEGSNYRVINSSAKAVLQHDAYSWECFGGYLSITTLSKKSEKLKSNLKEYLENMSDDERKNFVDTFFAVFEKSNITNIMQLKELKISTLLNIMKELKNIPATTKRNLIALLRMLITGMN